MRTARALALLLVAAAVTAVLVVDRDRDTGGDADEVAAATLMPTAPTPATLSSTWFCAGGTARQGSAADHTVVVVNPTDRALVGLATVFGGQVAPAPPSAAEDLEEDATTTTEGTTTTVEPPPPPPEPETQRFELPARSRVELRVGDVLESQLAGAVIEVNGGAVAVEHQVEGGLGRASAPCSTTTSSSWIFPWGVTARGSRELLVFFNPYADDATVDVDFATEEGARETVRFSGFVVPARSVVGAFVDEDVQRREQVSARVTTRTGRVVVDRIQMLDGTDGRRGITVGLGASEPSLVWTFPDGQVGEGITEQIVVFNPGGAPAEVEIDVALQDPDDNGVPEPFALTVAPGRFSIIDIHDEDRVPDDVPHSTVVRSLNEVPIVAERVIAATDPSPREGVSATLGSPLAAPTWLFAAGGPTDERDHWVTLVNVGTEDLVTVSIAGLAGGQEVPLQDLQELSVGPSERLAVRLGRSIGNRDALPVVVRADGPVVVERGLYRVGGLGLNTTVGIPLDTGLVIPDPLAG